MGSGVSAPAQPQAGWPPFFCPSHAVRLIPHPTGLSCPRGEVFPLKSGIPRFVPAGHYAAAFGAQWKRFRRTQLDSHTGHPLSRNRARRALGEELWHDLSGLQLLECGCGAGRFTEVLLAQGARVTSVDLSEAVEANQNNFPQNERHRIAQADILNLPFAPGSYDVVFCLGVIQHTPSPEATLESLYRQIRPGGMLVVDHYSHRLSWYTKSALPLRYYFRRLPPERGLPAIEKWVNRLLPLHQRVRGSRIAQVLLSRISPVLSYYQTLPQLNDELQRDWAVLDTHDALTCWYSHSRSRRAVRAALSRLGGKDIWCEYGDNGVVARTRRPEATG